MHLICHSRYHCNTQHLNFDRIALIGLCFIRFALHSESGFFTENIECDPIIGKSVYECASLLRPLFNRFDSLSIVTTLSSWTWYKFKWREDVALYGRAWFLNLCACLKAYMTRIPSKIRRDWLIIRAPIQTCNCWVWVSRFWGNGLIFETVSIVHSPNGNVNTSNEDIYETHTTLYIQYYGNAQPIGDFGLMQSMPSAIAYEFR